MRSVYVLTLRQVSGPFRLLIMAVLASMPLVIAALAVRSTRAGSVETFESVVLSTMFAGSIVPLIVLAVASTAFANEVEDKTLANLTMTPLPRWQIILPKLAAVVSVSAPFIVTSAFLTSMIAFSGDVTATIAVTVSAFTAVLMYSSAFVWTGLLTTRAIGLGLLYIVLWEGLFAGAVSGVRILSIRYLALALMHGLDARRFAGADSMSFGVSVVAATLICVGFFLLSIRRIRRMDIP